MQVARTIFFYAYVLVKIAHFDINKAYVINAKHITLMSVYLSVMFSIMQ